MGQWTICIYKARSNHQNAKGLLILYSLPYHCLIYFTTVPISPLTAVTIIIWSPTSYHHIIIKSSPSSYDHHHHDHDHDHQIITIIIWSPSLYDHQHHIITIIIIIIAIIVCWPAWRLFAWGNQGTQSKHLSDAVLDLWQSDRLTKLL